MTEEMEYINCSLCGSDEAQFLFARGSSNIVRCKKCGLVYHNPRKSEDKELALYRSSRISQKEVDRIRNARLKIFEETLAKIENHKRGKLLDIGCGFGDFLKIVRDKGWEGYGVELSREAVDFATNRLKLNVFEGTLKEAHFPDEFFEVVTLFNVLDHLCNPLEGLYEIERVLKRSGTIFIRTPNVTFHLLSRHIYQITQSVYKRVKGFAQKVDFKEPTIFHLYGFSANTLREMLRKTGFKEIHIANSILSSGDPYSSTRLFSPRAVGLVKKLVYTFAQIIFYLTAGRLILSSSLETFAKKSD